LRPVFGILYLSLFLIYVYVVIKLVLMLWKFFFQEDNAWMAMINVTRIPTDVDHSRGFRPCVHHPLPDYLPIDYTSRYTRCACDGLVKSTLFTDDGRNEVLKGRLVTIGCAVYIIGGEGQEYVRTPGLFVVRVGSRYGNWLLNLLQSVTHVGGCDLMSWFAGVLRWYGSVNTEILVDTGFISLAGENLTGGVNMMHEKKIHRSLDLDEKTGFVFSAFLLEFMHQTRRLAEVAHEKNPLDPKLFFRARVRAGPLGDAIKEIPCGNNIFASDQQLAVSGPPAVVVVPSLDIDEENPISFGNTPYVMDDGWASNQAVAFRGVGGGEERELDVVEDSPIEINELNGMMACDDQSPVSIEDAEKNMELITYVEALGEAAEEESVQDTVDNENEICEIAKETVWEPAFVTSGVSDLHRVGGENSGVRVDRVEVHKWKPLNSRGGVLGGNIIGSTGYVNAKGSTQTLNALKIRYATKRGIKITPNATSGGKTYVRPHIMPFTGLPGDCELVPTLSDVSEHWHYLEEQGCFKISLQKLKPMSRKRIVESLERCFEGVWSIKDELVTIFVKGDEKLMKKKPRIIVFVPSKSWIYNILWVDSIMQRIHSLPHQAVIHERSKTIHIFGCGMTQKALSEAATWAEEKIASGYGVFFLCGDDNTSEDTAEDFGSYDTTQRAFLLAAQLGVTRAWAGGLPESIYRDMIKWHQGQRSFPGVRYRTTGKALPSGCAWTLLLNSIGTYIVTMFSRHRMLRDLDVETRRGIISQWLGVEITGPIDMDRKTLIGKDFLKGVFAPCGNRVVWVPLPSRVAKAGCKILGNRDPAWTKNNDLMWSYVKEVAVGQTAFLLDPHIFGPYVSKFSNIEAKENKKPEWNWSMVQRGTNEDVEALRPSESESTQWSQWWFGFLDERYGMSPHHVSSFQRCLHEAGPGTGFVRCFGGAWINLLRVDYGAE